MFFGVDFTVFERVRLDTLSHSERVKELFKESRKVRWGVDMLPLLCGSGSAQLRVGRVFSQVIMEEISQSPARGLKRPW